MVDVSGSAGRSKPQMRARVLKAALAAFEEVGPDRVRVQDIATRAGMSSGHVMYYFGDRDRILFSTLLMSEENLGERRDRAAARAADADEALAAVSRLYLPTGPRDVRWALWAQVIARPPTDTELSRQLAEASDTWTDCIAELLSSRARRRQSAEPSATAARYCRLMDGLAMEVLLGGAGRSRSWAVAEAALALTALAG